MDYFMRDAYRQYGYDFQFYDGAEVDEARAKELIAGFTTLNRYIRETWRKITEPDGGGAGADPGGIAGRVHPGF